jgi:hypothetical protein
MRVDVGLETTPLRFDIIMQFLEMQSTKDYAGLSLPEEE